MKVVLLGDSGSVHMTRWSKGLIESGVDVVLVSQHDAPVGAGTSARTVRLPYSGQLGYLLNAAALRRVLATERPDILNAHYASGYGTTAQLAGFRPLLLSVWGSDVLMFPRKSFLHRSLIQRNLMAASRVASTSKMMAAEALKLVPGMLPPLITPFGVDPDMFRARAIGNPDRGGEITVGTVKSLAHHYGIDLVLTAFQRVLLRLRAERSAIAVRLRLRIVGDGPDKEKLIALAKGLGIESVTTFVDRVPHAQVPEELSKLDVFVALSRSESFGVAVVEASACGLPVVVSDVGGLPEVVRAGRTGLVVPTENPDAACLAIYDLVSNAKRRAAMGALGRAFVVQEYDWRTCVVRMVEAYEQVIAKSKEQLR